MRIALFPDEYLPESPRAHAKMFHDLAIELKQRGHEVIVITPGSSNQKQRLNISFIDGIEVWFFKCYPFRGGGKIVRAINESVLSIRAWRAIKNKVLLEPFDVCINYSPTIFFGPLMSKFKKAKECYIYLVLRDLFPQWIIDNGMISKYSPVALYFNFFEKLNYHVSDCIGLMSEANLEYFKSINPQCHNLRVLRNWSSTNKYYKKETIFNVRKEYALENKVIFLFGGNIGRAQDISNLIRLVFTMKNNKNAHFLFVGQGDEVDLLLRKRSLEDLTNLTFLPSKSQDEYQDILSQVDVGIFSLSSSHKANNFPGKILGYMYHSLPILGSANIGNELIDLINQKKSGLACVNGDDDALHNSAMRLVTDKRLRIECGENSRNMLEQYFSVQLAAQNILNEVEGI